MSEWLTQPPRWHTPYGILAHLELEEDGLRVAAIWQARPYDKDPLVLAWWPIDGNPGDVIGWDDVKRWLPQTNGGEPEPWNPEGNWLFDEDTPWTIDETRQGYRVTMD